MEKYKVIFATPDEKKLVELVNKEIDNGYIPIGGVSVVFSESHGLAFSQAMTLLTQPSQ